MSTDDRYTPDLADVDLLDRVLAAADCPHGAIGPGHVGCTLACSRCIARAVLSALAAAGRLRPGPLLGVRTHDRRIYAPQDVVLIYATPPAEETP